MNYKETGKLLVVAFCVTAIFGCKAKTGTEGANESQKKPGQALAVPGKWIYPQCGRR